MVTLVLVSPVDWDSFVDWRVKHLMKAFKAKGLIRSVSRKKTCARRPDLNPEEADH
jgi:hypothetical protein